MFIYLNQASESPILIKILKITSKILQGLFETLINVFRTENHPFHELPHPFCATFSLNNFMIISLLFYIIEYIFNNKCFIYLTISLINKKLQLMWKSKSLAQSLLWNVRKGERRGIGQAILSRVVCKALTLSTIIPTYCLQRNSLQNKFFNSTVFCKLFHFITAVQYGYNRVKDSRKLIWMKFEGSQAELWTVIQSLFFRWCRFSLRQAFQRDGRGFFSFLTLFNLEC